MIENSSAVHDVFTPVAPAYRAINHALTFGLDGYWRRQAVRRALRGGPAPAAALDVCTGTGETAALLQRLGRGKTVVTGVDFNAAMLREAERRAAGGIAFRQADATALPFTDGAFDVIAISFALRNLHVTTDRFTACLRECLRVLRPGGRLVTVETTQPPCAFVRWIVRRYVGLIVPRLGARLSGSRAAYAYLAGTIPRFHGAPELAAILRAAGFERVDYTYLTAGLVAIHEAVKAGKRAETENEREEGKETPHG